MYLMAQRELNYTNMTTWNLLPDQIFLYAAIAGKHIF